MTKSKIVFFFFLGILIGLTALPGFAQAPQSPRSPQHSQNPFAVPPGHVRILFVGDIMLDREVAEVATQQGVEYLFGSTTQLFADADLRVANLEGTITDNPSIAQTNHSILAFTFNPALAQQALSYLNVSAVSLANNHSYDWGVAGYNETRSYLSQFGVPAFGHPYNNSQFLSTTLSANGKTICLIGYMQLFNPAISTVVSAIQTMRPNCWREIVFAHWGVEYSTTTTQAQRDAARAFIDAGADAVVGAHPHVAQPLEMYEGKPIMYSLGNFMFDQNFSWLTEHGVALYIDFYDATTTLSFVPVTINHEHTAPATGEDGQRVLDLVGY